MKSGMKQRWMAACLAVACAGGLFSCEGAQNKQGQASQQATDQSQADTSREEEVGLDPSLAKPPFDPNAGAIPRNEAEYRAALRAIRQYDSLNPKAVVTSNYFSRKTINKIMQDTAQCAGVRIYRTYGNNKKGFGILIVGVDKTGKELKNPTQLKDGFSGEYLFGTSEERCPHNCGTFEVEQ